MTTRKNQSMDKRMFDAQLMINNSLNEPDILAALSQFGYDEQKLHEGKQLFEDVQSLSDVQLVEYGSQHAATDDLKKTWTAARKAYIRTLKVARIAFVDNTEAETALLMKGRRKQTLGGWMEQATTFYTNLLNNADLTQEMKRYGYNTDKLAAEADLIWAVVKAHAAQQQSKGIARQATNRRNAKMAELEAWLTDFRAIVRIALEECPTRLKQLGL
ncbi:MAG: hypothetical protein KDJ65_13565 [Anaerolineae bacterium]|nr:hypothetical protein [Anaerolineae bacterium]